VDLWGGTGRQNVTAAASVTGQDREYIDRQVCFRSETAWMGLPTEFLQLSSLMRGFLAAVRCNLRVLISIHQLLHTILTRKLKVTLPTRATTAVCLKAFIYNLKQYCAKPFCL
jgi:hypothetical protein